jgi:hypothetical protein
LGFVPIDAVNPLRHDGVGARYLLGLIAVNTVHNVLHLAIGASGLWSARGMQSARTWSKVVGIALLMLFGVGMTGAWTAGFPPDHSLFGLVSINSAGHVFHLATGIVALVLGSSYLRPTDETL